MLVTSEDLYFERQMPWSPFFGLTELRWEVIVHFVEIGGIVDHQSCLNVFFIIMIKALFLYFNLCLRLKLDSLMSIYIHIIYD
jgi:hypothetical protein